MGYRNEVDRIGAEVRAGVELDGTFEHAQEKIVRRAYSGSLVPGYVTRTNNTTAEAARPGFADEVFRDIFCLGVSCQEAFAGAGEVVGFEDGVIEV